MLDTIIIGAGFSGLAAAKRLRERESSNFLVLEARERVGGRTKSGSIAGLTIDLGGMWLGPSQQRLAALAKEYGVETYPTYLDGKAVISSNGKTVHGKREDYLGLFNLVEKLGYIPAEVKLKKLVADIDCKQPWQHKDAKELDAITVDTWLQQNTHSERIKQLYRVICWSLFCAEADQISMLFFLFYLKSGDGLDVMLSADAGGAQNFLFHGGVHQIAQRMADEIGDKLRLNSPVTGIDWADDSVTVHTPQGPLQARNVIVTVPQPMIRSLEFNPPLPQAKAELHQQQAMGSVIKYWVAYSRPFWREQGFNGLIAGDDSPVLPCFDVSPPDQPLGLISGFFDAEDAVLYGDCSEAERRQVVIDLLTQHYGEEARNPVDYVDNNWMAERWSQGCYGAYTPPGALARYGEWLRKPIGPLFWAGTESAEHWTGYIDGAISAGERAAEESINAPDLLVPEILKQKPLI